MQHDSSLIETLIPGCLVSCCGRVVASKAELVNQDSSRYEVTSTDETWPAPEMARPG